MRSPATPDARRCRGIAGRGRVLGTDDPVVAQRSGTSTGLIYQYFADKQDIFMALLDENIVESTRAVAALPRDRAWPR